MMRWVLVGLAAADFLDGPEPRRLSPGQKNTCQGLQDDIQLCTEELCADDALQCTPLNGAWAEWGDWSSCSCSGVRERHRAIGHHAECGGIQVSGPEIEAIDCAPTCHKDEPVMCEAGDWSDWSTCDRDCGGGERIQNRKITTEPKNCGQTCTMPLRRAEGCNMQQCGDFIPCTVSDWSAWGTCSTTCGGGQMTKTRTIASEAIGGAAGCDKELSETTGCSQGCCDEGPQDCVWANWAEWSECSVSCDGGVRSRVKGLAAAPRIGGKMCEAADVMAYETCNTISCGFIPAEDGTWSEWGVWSVCSRTCGEGFRSKHRAVLTLPAHGGKAAEGDAQVFETCDLGSCNTDAINCAFNSWSSWGACSSTFKGTRGRNRQIGIYADRGGFPCDGPLAEVEACNDMALVAAVGVPQNCVFDSWEPWGYCSKTCGGGTKKRARVIKVPRLNGGDACEGATGEATACNEDVCHESCDHDQDCKWSVWLEWSDCSRTCDGGERLRYRTIALPAMNFGKECIQDLSREVESCNTHHCGQELFCVWNDWSAFSPCSATCGAGTKKRNRNLGMSSIPDDMALETSYKAGLIGAVEIGPSGLMMCASAGLMSVMAASLLFRSRPEATVVAQE